MGRALAIVMVIVVLSSCTGEEPSTPRARSSPATSPSSLPTRPPVTKVADSFGPAPKTCPRFTHEPRPVARFYGPLVGRAPLWAGVYALFDSHRDAFRILDPPRRNRGYRVKILWILDARTKGRLTLTGSNLETFDPVWFSFEGPPRPFAIIDPAMPGTVSEHPAWAEYPSYAFFPRSGCYEFEAGTESGPWRMVLAIGR